MTEKNDGAITPTPEQAAAIARDRARMIANLAPQGEGFYDRLRRMGRRDAPTVEEHKEDQ